MSQEGFLFPCPQKNSTGPQAQLSLRTLPRCLLSTLQRLWNHPVMLRLRLGASKIIRNTQHSSHLRHAMKNAIGSHAKFPSFSSFYFSRFIYSRPQSNGQMRMVTRSMLGFRWFTWIHGQWMVIHYVWVLETNTGATWRVGYLRLVSLVSAF